MFTEVSPPQPIRLMCWPRSAPEETGLPASLGPAVQGYLSQVGSGRFQALVATGFGLRFGTVVFSRAQDQALAYLGCAEALVWQIECLWCVCVGRGGGCWGGKHRFTGTAPNCSPEALPQEAPWEPQSWARPPLAGRDLTGLISLTSGTKSSSAALTSLLSGAPLRPDSVTLGPRSWSCARQAPRGHGTPVWKHFSQCYSSCLRQLSFLPFLFLLSCLVTGGLRTLSNSLTAHTPPRRG